MTAYSLDAYLAGYNALLAYILDGASPPEVRICKADGTVLAAAIIDPEESEVSAIDATLTLAIAEQEDSAPEGGESAYAEVVNGAGDPVLRVPCKEGVVPEAGFCVVNALTVIAGTPYEVVSITIEAGALIEE